MAGAAPRTVHTAGGASDSTSPNALVSSVTCTSPPASDNETATEEASELSLLLLGRLSLSLFIESVMLTELRPIIAAKSARLPPSIEQRFGVQRRVLLEDLGRNAMGVTINCFQMALTRCQREPLLRPVRTNHNVTCAALAARKPRDTEAAAKPPATPPCRPRSCHAHPESREDAVGCGRGC